VLIRARAVVKSGVLSRTVTITKKFFLPQPPPGSESGDNDSDNDDEE